jgi:hypothetical protein
MGADVIVAVDVSTKMETFSGGSGLDIVMRADAVARVRLNDLLLEGADVLIHPDVEGRHWADFGNPRELFQRGETAASNGLSRPDGDPAGKPARKGRGEGDSADTCG